MKHDSTKTPSDQTFRHVTDLLLLQQQVRATPTLAELGYLVSNDTRKIAPYQVAILSFEFHGNQKIEAISGLPKSTDNSPFSNWFKRFYKSVRAEYAQKSAVVKLEGLSGEVRESLNDFLPSQILYLPLIHPNENKQVGVLILARKQVWLKEEMAVLDYWAGAISHAVSFLHFRKKNILSTVKNSRTWLWGIVVLIVAALLLTPVSLTALAPAEIVPKSPDIIKSPIDGVINEVFVRPNMAVEKGELLLRLDDVSLNARVDVARQELVIAKAEYRRAEQASVFDRKASANIPMLKAKIEQQKAELNYIKSLLDRINIRAKKAGVVMVADVEKLEGKPVSLGEKIMTISSPKVTQVEIWLAVGDSLSLIDGAKIVLFLNIHPETPLKATLEYINYQAELSPEGILAFRTRAHIDEKDLPRVGLRGTAKLYGETVPLYYYLFRRPYAAVRQRLGL